MQAPLAHLPPHPGSRPLYLGSDLVAALARLDVHDLSHAAPAAGLLRRRRRRAGGRRAAAGAAGAERLEEAARLCRRVLSGAPAAPGLGADVTADASANPEAPLQNTAPAAASGPGASAEGEEAALDLAPWDRALRLLHMCYAARLCWRGALLSVCGGLQARTPPPRSENKSGLQLNFVSARVSILWLGRGALFCFQLAFIMHFL